MDKRRSRSNSMGDVSDPNTDVKDMLAKLMNDIQLQNIQIQQQIKADLQAQNLQTQIQIQTHTDKVQGNIQNLQADIRADMTKHIHIVQETIIEFKTEITQKIETIQTENVQTQRQLDKLKEQQAEINVQLYSEISNCESGMTVKLLQTKENILTQLSLTRNEIFNEQNGLTEKVKKQGEEMSVIRKETKQYEEEQKKQKDKVTSIHVDMCLREELNKLEDKKKFDEIKKELEQLRKTGSRIVTVEGQNMGNIRPEMWPKFKGMNDTIHPMTYLRNIISLTEEVADDKIRMKMIKLTLENQALEWMEMFTGREFKVDDFQREFRKKYWSDEVQNRLRVILLTGRYKEGGKSRELYACGLYNQCKHLENITEREIAKYLLKHFVQTDGSSIIFRQIQDIDELMEILRKLDDLEEVRKERKNLYEEAVRRNQESRGNNRTPPHTPPNNSNYRDGLRGGNNSRPPNNNIRPFVAYNRNNGYQNERQHNPQIQRGNYQGPQGNNYQNQQRYGNNTYQNGRSQMPGRDYYRQEPRINNIRAYTGQAQTRQVNRTENNQERVEEQYEGEKKTPIEPKLVEIDRERQSTSREY